MHITRLRPDPRAPDCLIVEVDGARFASVPADAVRDLGLKAGVTLEREQKERLSFLADVEGAKRVALRLLATRPRSVQEVLRRLRHRGHNPSAAAEVVGRLESKGLLDDRAYAEHFARVRGERGHGRSRLLTDLLAKGVDRRLAERSIDQVLELEGGDQLAKARAVAEKRARQLGALPKAKLERRLLAYLARRGFSGRDVRDMVGEVVAHTPDR